MADKDLTIGLKTTGAQRGAAEIDQMTDSVVDLGNAAPRTAAQLDEVADAARQLGTSKTGYGSKGPNAGMAALEFSRAFEDAQYGIRGVLNNIPSLIFAIGGSAGLAGVISIAAVAGSTLWTKFSGGAKDAKKDTDDLLETFKQLVEVYTGLDQSNAEDRKKAAENATQGLANAVRSAELANTISGNRGGIQIAREVAELNLEITRDRIRLAEVEKAAVLAAGQDAVRLARERADIIQRVFETELAISEAGRRRELDAARGRLTLAESKATSTGEVDAVLTGQADELRKRFEELSGQADKLRDARFEEIDLINAQIKAERARLDERLANIGEFSDPEALIRASTKIVEGLLGRRERADQGTQAEEQFRAEAVATQDALDALEPQLAASAEAQLAAARAMTDAAIALGALSQNQGVARQSEVELKATQQIGQVGGDVTQAARDAIAAINTNATNQGRPPSANEQEAIGEINKILNDTTPDAEQAGQLAGKLQVLANNLNAKDAILAGGVETLIGTTKGLATKYEDLVKRINDVAEKVNQSK